MNDEFKSENLSEVPAKPKSNRNKIIIAIVGVIILCCCATLAYGAYLSSTPEGQASATTRAQEQEATRSESNAVAVIEATEDARPTDTPSPPETPEPTNTPAPTDTPTPTPLPPAPTPLPIGLSRNNPYPMTELVNAPNWDIRILEVVRGDEAWQAIQSANQFNDPPKDGMEYLLVKLSVKSTYTDSEAHQIGESDFRVTGDHYFRYFTAPVVAPDPQLDAELFAGAETEGWAVYEIYANEGNLILIVDELFSFDEDRYRYVALEEGASVTVPQELTNIAPTELGIERNNPAPFGETVVTEDWEITVTDVVKGEDAWNMVQEANQFNDPPDEGMEYVVVKIKARYINSTDEAESIDITFFNTTGDAGVIYDPPFVVAPEPSLDMDFYPGGEFEGWIVGQVAEGETGLKLIFSPIFEFTNANRRFLSLEP